MKTFPAIAFLVMLSTTVFGADLKLPEVGEKRAATLKANIKDLQLALSYDGQSDKPYYGLLLSVPKVNVKQADAFFLLAQLSEDQAHKIIAHLAEAGMLDRAFEKGEAVKLPHPSYRLTIIAGDLNLSVSLGWGKDTLNSLDDLSKMLDGDAAKEMDILLARMSGHRKEWDEAEKQEIARLNQFYPNGFHFVDTLRADGKILWITKEFIEGKVKAQRQEIASLEDFKKTFLKANVNKEASVEIYVRFVQIEGATKRAEAIVQFLKVEGYKKAGVVSN